MEKSRRVSDIILADFINNSVKWQGDTTERLARNETKLESVEKEVGKLDGKISALNDSLNKHVADQQRLEEKVENHAMRLSSVERTVASLDVERNMQSGAQKSVAEQWSHRGVVAAMIATGIAAVGFVIKFF